VQANGLVEGPLPVVRKRRIDFPRDEAVLRVALVDLREEIERRFDVASRELQENLLRIRVLHEELFHLLVVRIARRERLLEDGRVRRHADDVPVTYQVTEVPCADAVAAQVVDPDGDSGG